MKEEHVAILNEVLPKLRQVYKELSKELEDNHIPNNPDLETCIEVQYLEEAVENVYAAIENHLLRCKT